ncbi:tRNA-dihydrouridine synthase [Patescibacteria group bacterium]|nr:tRNA-dihydrouridine synthase [Patescibacteria group bacterium]
MANNFWNDFKKPIIALAPMAGINDIAFREMCSQYGADVLYSEMASATALTKNPEKTLDMLSYTEKQRPYVVQLFGYHPEHFKIAVKVIEKEIKPDGIDINFGCPVNKVLRQGAGAVLMKDKEQAKKIIATTISQATVPVSIKTRTKSGQVELLDFLDYISDLDIKALMIHGRTLSQGFSGEIDYKTILKARDKFKGIILANGGINDIDSAKKTLDKTKADGLGLARGVMGRPWLFQEIKEEKDLNYNRDKIIDLALKHSKLAYKYKKDFGLKEMRKHLSWYISSWPGARALRQELVRIESIEDIKKAFEKYETIYR